MTPHPVGQGMTQSVSSSSGSDVYSRAYFDEIQAMFMSVDFKEARGRAKKDLIGNTIYKHVEKIVGENRAPKITGMLIDLPEAELNFSISSWANFEAKVVSALTLISNNTPAGGQAPVNSQASPQKV